MNTNRYCLITISTFIVALSIAILGFVTTVVALLLSGMYLVIEEVIASIPNHDEVPIQLLIGAVFITIAALISMSVLLSSMFYMGFWVISIHLWFKYDE
jgi:hypothetical protein